MIWAIKQKYESKIAWGDLMILAGIMRWIATRANLIFNSNSDLRALSEVYSSNDAKLKFIDDFTMA